MRKSIYFWTGLKPNPIVPLFPQNSKDHILPARILNQFKHKIQLDFQKFRKAGISCLWRFSQYSKQSYSCNYNYSCNRFKYSKLRPSKYLQKLLSQFITDTVSDNTCVWQTVQLGVLTNLINSTSGALSLSFIYSANSERIMRKGA